MATAKNRALNQLKRSELMGQRAELLGHEPEAHAPLAAVEETMDEQVRDDVLRLVFVACHPLLSGEARAALTLRMIGGLSTAEIARAFLTTEPTVAQRVVRAKRTLADAGVPFEVPGVEELGARLRSVLEVVYLIFNEGYTASGGSELMRPTLAAEALRLGELLCGLAPAEPEVHGLDALMALHASRAAARVDAENEPVLLTEQDRSKWDAGLMLRGLRSLARAEALTKRGGPYQLQAGIAACHARAGSVEQTDWQRIASLYAQLYTLAPSPVVELNRAMAVSRAEGPAAGLALLDALVGSQELERYPFLPAARAELLEQLGRHEEAAAEFERAAGLTENARQKKRLLTRSRYGSRSS
ncbi:MAG: RNA polymerase subunit sigma-24 [Archangiaceae bacterium]|nr:RNA polymerase subunit sigma-24 [Archangiaceae bacterium]